MLGGHHLAIATAACGPSQQRCTCQGKLWRWLSIHGIPPPHCRWGLQSCCPQWPWHAWARGTFSEHPPVCRSQRQRWAQCSAMTVLACGTSVTERLQVDYLAADTVRFGTQVAAFAAAKCLHECQVMHGPFTCRILCTSDSLCTQECACHKLRP